MEALFGEILGQAFIALFFVAVGFGYLYLRFRNRVRVKDVLAKKYENSYANAGMAVVLNSVAIIGIALVFFLMIAPLLHWLNN